MKSGYGWMGRTLVAGAAVCLVQGLSGCAGGSVSAVAPDSAVAIPHLRGGVHGGQQPVFKNTLGMGAHALAIAF